VQALQLPTGNAITCLVGNGEDVLAGTSAGLLSVISPKSPGARVYRYERDIKLPRITLFMLILFFCSGSQVWHLTAAELEQGAISTLLLCDGKLWVAVKELIGCFDPAKCVARFSVYQRESG
jgi:hypothetical protein